MVYITDVGVSRFCGPFDAAPSGYLKVFLGGRRLGGGARQPAVGPHYDGGAALGWVTAKLIVGRRRRLLPGSQPTSLECYYPK